MNILYELIYQGIVLQKTFEEDICRYIIKRQQEDEDRKVESIIEKPKLNPTKQNKDYGVF